MSSVALSKKYKLKILWYVDSLLGGDREINYSAAVVARQRSARQHLNNRGTVFSVRSVLRCYK
jgi:hypothetical protein